MSLWGSAHGHILPPSPHLQRKANVETSLWLSWSCLGAVGRPQDSGQKMDSTPLMCDLGQVTLTLQLKFCQRKMRTIMLDSVYYLGFCDYQMNLSLYFYLFQSVGLQ